MQDVQDIFRAESETKPDLEWFVTYLERALLSFQLDPQTPQCLQELARKYPDAFFGAALRILGTNDVSRGYRYLANLVLRDDSMFQRLTNPARCSLNAAVFDFRCLLKLDPTLDFRLARLLPGPRDSAYSTSLRGAHADRALHILDQTSAGQRLVSVLRHLTKSEDPRLSSTAALFLGRRVNNPGWITKQMWSENPRVRANVLEAAWGTASQDTIRILHECTSDSNNRVAGNALIGLHLAGCPDVTQRALALSRAADPGRRSTAAWAMGKIGTSDFVERLTELLKDEYRPVRSAAIRSLVELGRALGKNLSVPASAEKETVPENPPAVLETHVPEPASRVAEVLVDLRLDGSYKSLGQR